VECVSPTWLDNGVKFSQGKVGTIGVEKLDRPSDFKLDKLYLDIGASSREEAEQIVHIGETAVFVGDFVESGYRIIAKALDDRIGCFVAMEAFKRTKSTHELAFVFTAQEEIGTRGAKTAAYALHSPAEMIDKRDVETAVDLLVALLERPIEL